MVKSVDFAVRNVMGGVSRGVVSGEGASDYIAVGSGDEISLNLRKTNILKYMREGNDLQIVLVDGRTITLSGYYDAIPGEENRLYISSDGEITAVTLEESGDGVIFAQYSQPEVIGKWSMNDPLAFLDGEDLIAPAVVGDTTGMAAFAPLLLGGIGSGGLVAAGVAGAAVIGGSSGGGGGGGRDEIVPTVDHPDADSTLTTHAADPAAVVTGTGEAGSTVIVELGDQTLQTTVGEDGTWGVRFEGDSFPSDGDLSSRVTVSAPDGTVTELDGPDFLIDMTPPDVAVMAGALSTGDVENHSEYQDGISVSGTSEAGAAITVTVAGHTQSTVAGADGSWSVTFPTTELPAGSYTEAMTITATDVHGNTNTINDTLIVDTDITLTQTAVPGGADGVVSAAELPAGVTIGGAVDAGSSVVVTLATGQTITASVVDGSWSAAIPTAGMSGEGVLGYTVSATDPNGNTASLAGSVVYDTVLNTLTAGTTTNTTVVNDAYVNAAEGAAGIVLSGAVEAGAQSVTVTLADGHTISGTITGTSWTATVPAAYATGEGTLTYTVNAVDAYGNTLQTPVSGAVMYDTMVRDFTQTANVTSDDMVNAREAAAGFAISGTVEPNSDIVVRLETGAMRTVHVGADGIWSVNFTAADLAGANGTLHYTVTATDHAGNVAVLGDDSSLSFNVDLVAPEAPAIEAVTLTTNTENVRAIYTDSDGEGAYAIHGVNAAGDVSSVALSSGGPISLGEEDLYNFSSSVPNGSYLVVTDTDAAGNEASTLLVVDNNSAVSVDLTRAGLAEFDFAAIDLSFAEADLTITAEQITALTGPDKTLVIQGDAADHITAIGAQDTGQEQVIGGKSYSVYTLGDDGASLIIDDQITHLTI